MIASQRVWRYTCITDLLPHRSSTPCSGRAHPVPSRLMAQLLCQLRGLENLKKSETLRPLQARRCSKERLCALFRHADAQKRDFAPFSGTQILKSEILRPFSGSQICVHSRLTACPLGNPEMDKSALSNQDLVVIWGLYPLFILAQARILATWQNVVPIQLSAF